MGLLEKVKRMVESRSAEQAHHRCQDCKAEFKENRDTCPECGSSNISTFERVASD